MRKLKRLVAMYHIKNAGITHICKHKKGEDSFFAEHWREWI